MTTTDVHVVLEDWAAAWSSHDPERVLALFTDDCVYEEVTFGVVMRGRNELRAFAEAAFDAVPDFTFQLTSRFAAGSLAGIEWLMSATHQGASPGLRATGKRFSGIRVETTIQFA